MKTRQATKIIKAGERIADVLGVQTVCQVYEAGALPWRWSTWNKACGVFLRRLYRGVRAAAR